MMLRFAEKEVLGEPLGFKVLFASSQRGGTIAG
jgi:hypothetical protein